MSDLIPMLLLGATGGGIVGWVVGHQMASSASSSGGESLDGPGNSLRSVEEEQQQLEAVASKIRALTLSVAADVSAHQTKVAGITNELQVADPTPHSQSIVSAVADLIAANQAMQNRLSESQKQIREQTKQLQTTQQLANTDALTGLANRRVLDKKLAEIGGGETDGPRPVVALIDIDHFKSVNDTYGHTTGDDVLSHVAGLIESRLGEHATCARYGGEEFAVVSDQLTQRELAQALDSARDELSRLRLITEAPQRAITFSSGVAERLADEASDVWLERADRALYAAKRNGRNSIYICQGEVTKRFSPEQPSANGARKKKAVTRETSTDQLRSLAANLDLEELNLAAVAIRLPALSIDAPQRQTLLDNARSLLRGVDRIDFENDRTLLAMMVTANTEKASDRANQLLDLVNRTLRDLEIDSDEPAVATVGIAFLDDRAAADDVIQTAIEKAGTTTAERPLPAAATATRGPAPALYDQRV